MENVEKPGYNALQLNVIGDGRMDGQSNLPVEVDMRLKCKRNLSSYNLLSRPGYNALQLTVTGDGRVDGQSNSSNCA